MFFAFLSVVFFFMACASLLGMIILGVIVLFRKASTSTGRLADFGRGSSSSSDSSGGSWGSDDNDGHGDSGSDGGGGDGGGDGGD
jgi:hypothetical protein